MCRCPAYLGMLSPLLGEEAVDDALDEAVRDDHEEQEERAEHDQPALRRTRGIRGGHRIAGAHSWGCCAPHPSARIDQGAASPIVKGVKPRRPV